MEIGSVARREGLLDVAAFAGTVVWAAVARWKADDLVWALWLSSFVVGYATIVTTIVRGVREQWASRHLAALAGGAGLLAFFTVHFGGFHVVHGVFLNSFFPLVDDTTSAPGAFGVALVALAGYWPFVIASLIARLDDVGGRPSKKRSRRRGKTVASQADLMAPYKNVVRMHLLIFVFAGLHMAGLSRLAVYPVLAVYFFPWGTTFGKRGIEFA